MYCLGTGIIDAKGFVMQYLPDLTPIEFHILVSLLAGERNGLDLIRETAARTKNQVFLVPGTLYTALKRMVAQGWITFGQSRSASGADDRKQYYRLTELGFTMIDAEVSRMEHVAIETRRLIEGSSDGQKAIALGSSY